MISTIYKNQNLNDIDLGYGDWNRPLMVGIDRIVCEFLDNGITETEWTKKIKTLSVNFPKNEKMITFI